MRADAREWLIEPRIPSLFARAEELWRYRHLLRFFSARALEKLYKRTILGRAWLLIRPTVTVGINTIIFGGLLGVQSESVPYLLFYLAGTTSWQLFAQCLLWATRSLEMNRKTLRRVYIPRLLLPLATLSPALLNFAINLGFIALVVAYYFVTEGRLYINGPAGLVVALASAVLCIAFALGLGLWTSVWGAIARDIRFTLAYVLDLWFFLTPVIYPLSLVPEAWRPLAALNPMSALVEAFKWGTIGVGQLDSLALAASAATIGTTLVLGLWYFNRVETLSVDRL